MTRRDRFLAGFLALAVLQLAVPASRLVMREITLRTGTRFKFKTAPVDPYDAFRGRYVAVRVAEDRAPYAGAALPKHGTKVYISIAEGEDGFARLSAASMSCPAGPDYIAGRMAGVVFTNEIRVALPLDRFYMNEKLAPKAEHAYRQRGEGREAWLAVRVRKGMAVIEDLYIGDKTITDYLKTE